MQSTVIPIVAQHSAPTRERKRQQPKGRAVSPAARAQVLALVGPGPYRRDLLIEYLHKIQDDQRCLPTPMLAALAQLLKLSQAEVYEVASFYHHFDVVREDENGNTAAAPALTVRVCDGLPCEMAGGAALLARLRETLGADIRVIPAPCVGRCDSAPVAVVHQRPVHRATLERVQSTVAGGERCDDVGGTIDLSTYRANGGYSLLAECHAGRHSADSLMQTLEDAGLRGLGGAGFPAGRKWRIVRGMPAPRLMAVNIDEGEPGTFKDRWYLERDPHRFIEGLLVAAWAVDVAAVYIYLRDEYHACRALLQAELEALRAAPGLPPLPHIELRRGAGAYICGEESAMIESIEGKRGLPRLRPPYVAEVGLFGRPTLEHNFETLYWVRDLVQRGAAWFAGQGRHGRKGLRSFSVSGRVAQPGVKLAPAGITLRELIDEHCGGMADGHRLYAYLPGGASGGILPASLADVPLDFDTLQPHGAFIGSAAVIVLSEQDRAVVAARNVMRFFEHESCGQCTPCRVGTAKANQLMAAPQWNAPLLGELGAVMRDASICGLGQAAPNAFDSVLRYFAHEVRA
jgi:NADH:ubiquinone oxidoreductase subunit F (NADH-binding)/NADH:ubiquinone oxidoreductase subunit E